MGPLGGEGGEEIRRERERERERRYVGGSRGRWACCFDGIPSKQAVFFETFCGEHNLYKHVQKMNTCPVLICKD